MDIAAIAGRRAFNPAHYNQHNRMLCFSCATWILPLDFTHCCGSANERSRIFWELTALPARVRGRWALNRRHVGRPRFLRTCGRHQHAAAVGEEG